MDTDFRAIYQIDKAPPTFLRDNLTWSLGVFHEEGVEYFLKRNDGLPPTDEDYELVSGCVRFIVQPCYGPQQ